MFTNNNNNNPFQTNSTNPFNNNTNTGNAGTGLFRTDAQQQQQRNMFGNSNTPSFGNNTSGLFANNNTSAGAPSFNNANNSNTNTGGNMFSNNTGGSMFNNNNTPGNTGGNMFNNNTPNTSNNLFNTNTNTGGNMFNNNTGGSMFNNNTGGSMFNNNSTPNTSTGGNMFGGNTNTGGSMFNTPSTGSNMFNNQPTNSPMFGSTNTQTNNLFNRGNTPANNTMGMGTNNNNYYANQSLAFQNSLANIKISLEQCVNRIASRNLEGIRLDSWNVFKDKQLNKIPLKNQVLNIMMGFHQLEKTLKKLKESNTLIQNKMGGFSKDCHKKLGLYKKCLLQTVSHTKLIEEVSNELDLMNKEMEEYFKPLYNAYKTKKKISVKDPNEFDLKVSYDVLNKLEILNQRVDDMIACESQTEEDVENTITVFEQLIQYYQNVSCSFKDFSHRYNNLKRTAIERERIGSYEAVMSKVTGKVEQNLKKQFKYYDLIKQIDDLLAEKEKREEKKKLDSKNKFNSVSSRRSYF